jgi:hypothetical protein
MNEVSTNVTFVDKVKEKIKNTFADLIPEEQWDEMIQKEINSFFEDKQKITISEIKKYANGSWRNEEFLVKEMEISPFRAMVYAECIQKTNQTLKETIDKTYFTEIWDKNGKVITEEFKTVITECGPAIAAKFFSNLIGQMTSDMRMSLMNNNIR